MIEQVLVFVLAVAVFAVVGIGLVCWSPRAWPLADRLTDPTTRMPVTGPD